MENLQKIGHVIEDLQFFGDQNLRHNFRVRQIFWRSKLETQFRVAPIFWQLFGIKGFVAIRIYKPISELFLLDFFDWVLFLFLVNPATY